MFDFNPTNLTPTNNWEKVGNIAKNNNTDKKFKIYSELNDRLIFVGLATIGSVFQTISILVIMTFIVIFSVKNLFTWNKKELKIIPSKLLAITICALMRIVILPVCSIFGIFSPNNAKQIYKEIEKNTWSMCHLNIIFEVPIKIEVGSSEGVPIEN